MSLAKTTAIFGRLHINEPFVTATVRDSISKSDVTEMMCKVAEEESHARSGIQSI